MGDFLLDSLPSTQSGQNQRYILKTIKDGEIVNPPSKPNEFVPWLEEQAGRLNVPVEKLVKEEMGYKSVAHLKSLLDGIKVKQTSYDVQEEEVGLPDGEEAEEIFAKVSSNAVRWAKDAKGTDTFTVDAAMADLSTLGTELIPFALIDLSLRWYGNSESRFESGIFLESVLTRSVPPFDDFKGDLGKQGTSDFRLYLPAALSAFFTFRFGDAYESWAKFEFGLNDNDPRVQPYGRKELKTLVKYYALNTGDVGPKLSFEYNEVKGLSLYGRTSYNPVADINPDITEDKPFENTNTQSIDTLLGARYSFGKTAAVFTQIHYQGLKMEGLEGWKNQFGFAAGGNLKLDWFGLGLQGYYYPSLESSFAGFSSQYGVMGNLDFDLGKQFHLRPFAGLSSAVREESVGSSCKLGCDDFDVTRKVVEAGLGVYWNYDEGKFVGASCAYVSSSQGNNEGFGDNVICGVGGKFK